MKKLNFKWLVMLCIAMGFATVAKAQIYSSETCFYVHQTYGDKNYIHIFRFSGNKMYQIPGRPSDVKSLLTKSLSYFDNFTTATTTNHYAYKGHPVEYVYDESMSTSSRMVYEEALTYGHNYSNLRHYWAFSEDLSSVIEFYMDRDRTRIDTKTYGDKKYYIKVSPEDLLPKSINPDEIDFLNE